MKKYFSQKSLLFSDNFPISKKKFPADMEIIPNPR